MSSDQSRSQSCSFSILTLNVLADAYSRPNSYPHCSTDKDAVCPLTVLLWQHRSQNLIEIIKLRNATILCLQEVDHYNDFWSIQLSKLGYDCIYVQRGEQTQSSLDAIQNDYNLYTTRQRMLAQRRHFNANKAAATAQQQSATASNNDQWHNNKSQSKRLEALKDDGCCIAFKRSEFELAAVPWSVDMNNVAKGQHVNNRTHLSQQRYMKQNVGLIVALRRKINTNCQNESSSNVNNQSLSSYELLVWS
jgi:mRNA deadenylase 3'-5' endonuclease subunit Ccr4